MSDFDEVEERLARARGDLRFIRDFLSQRINGKHFDHRIQTARGVLNALGTLDAAVGQLKRDKP